MASQGIRSVEIDEAVSLPVRRTDDILSVSVRRLPWMEHEQTARDPRDANAPSTSHTYAFLLAMRRRIRRSSGAAMEGEHEGAGCEYEIKAPAGNAENNLGELIQSRQVMTDSSRR